MKDTKRWTPLGFALAIAAIGYLAIDASTAAQVRRSTDNTSASAPAPTPGQKKVLLKNLGMA
jgi:hypothetical protein